MLWCIWQERNTKVFEDKTEPNEVLLARVERVIMEHNTYAQTMYKSNVPRHSQSINRWCPPPPGIVKLNLDALLNVEGCIGMGVVARNDKGEVLFSTTRRVRTWWPGEIAKSKALLALKLAQCHGYENTILESNSQVFVNHLSQVVIYLSKFDSVLENILFSSSNFYSVVWSHVRRWGNFIAYHLAKIVPFKVEQVWKNHYPMEIDPCVLSDTLSIE